MLVKLTKAYEEVAKKSHRMRLDSLEVFIFHYLGVFIMVEQQGDTDAPTVIQRPGQLMGTGRVPEDAHHE